MEENLRQHPQKTIEIKHSIEQGDRVAVMSHVTFGPGDRGYALAHFFRFEGDRIAELWDMAQEIPDNSPNTSGRCTYFWITVTGRAISDYTRCSIKAERNAELRKRGRRTEGRLCRPPGLPFRGMKSASKVK